MHGSPTRPLAALATLALPLAAITLSGCVSAQSPPGNSPMPLPAVSAETRPLPHEPSAPLRTARYTLANTLPRADQLDLLRQVIDIHLPDQLTSSVQDAMTHVLRRSGYHLCPAADAVQVLYAHPLPAAHYHLGPITVRNALLALAGPAWQMEVDERARRICFSATTLAGGQG